MRRSRRGGHSGMEFGGSGEDSFVAVVVTKLTGALLFILLLTMVIMALLPKAIDLPSSEKPGGERDAPPLAIATPEDLPEAIAGRPYALALAAKGGRGEVRWAVDGKLPEGLEFDAEAGRPPGDPLEGDARAGLAGPPRLRRFGSGRRPGPPGGLPARPPVDGPLEVDARPAADPLARVVRPGVRVPRPGPGPHGRHERPGLARTPEAGRPRGRRGRVDPLAGSSCIGACSAWPRSARPSRWRSG